MTGGDIYRGVIISSNTRCSPPYMLKSPASGATVISGALLTRTEIELRSPSRRCGVMSQPKAVYPPRCCPI